MDRKCNVAFSNSIRIQRRHQALLAGRNNSSELHLSMQFSQHMNLTGNYSLIMNVDGYLKIVFESVASPEMQAHAEMS